MLRRIAVGVVLALLVALPATAQDYQKGLAAAQSGDYVTALKEWRPLAERGDAQAQRDLGLMYNNGQGVPKDYAEAVEWYRRAAEQGLVSAQNNLGFMYERGRGVPKDYAKAVKWLRKAANQGHAVAQYNLGLMFRRGQGVPQDNTKAVKWYRRAAEQGQANAQHNLDFMQKKGRSAPRKAVLATARGDFRVQLGAFRSKARAVKKAKSLISLHKHTLGRLTIVPVRADLGSRGVYYRLRVGPFPDRATANSLCHMLSAHQQNCIMVKP